MKKYNVYGIMAAALVGACALVGCAKDSDVPGTDVTGNADISGSQASDAADESKAEQTDGEAGIQGTDTEATGAQGTDNEAADENKVVAPLTNLVSDELYSVADQWPSCDDTALAAVMKKAAKGEHVVIACIGGSITQGTISSGSSDSEVPFKRSYADIFFEWWKDTFPEADFEFVNAGIGGTDSYLGVHRVNKDVLEYEPDLVLVEFSVNDEDSLFYKKTYDNLVRKILLSDSRPAVMLLYMGQTNGATAQGNHVFVGFSYKLPMLSYSSLINDMMEQKVYTDKQLSGDELHPSALGHAITGEILWKYLNNVYENVDSYGEPQRFDMAAVMKESYINADIIDSSAADVISAGDFEKKRVCTQFPYGWECTKGEGKLEIKAEFQNLGILYFATTNGLGGQYDVYVDGEYAGTINADFSGGWGNAIKAKQVYTSDSSVEHTITIKKSPDSTGDLFDLLGLLVS